MDEKGVHCLCASSTTATRCVAVVGAASRARHARQILAVADAARAVHSVLAGALEAKRRIHRRALDGQNHVQRVRRRRRGVGGGSGGGAIGTLGGSTGCGGARGTLSHGRSRRSRCSGRARGVLRLEVSYEAGRRNRQGRPLHTRGRRCRRHVAVMRQEAARVKRGVRGAKFALSGRCRREGALRLALRCERAGRRRRCRPVALRSAVRPAARAARARGPHGTRREALAQPPPRRRAPMRRIDDEAPTFSTPSLGFRPLSSFR